MNQRSPSVLFLVPYPERKAPSQRFRVESYFPLLDRAGISYRVEPFLSAATGRILYNRGQLLRKTFGVFAGFLRRLLVVLFTAPRYSYIFIHREAAPVGPPVFEWLLARVFRKKLIFDFDDAIWIPNTSGANRLANAAKCFWKVAPIACWSHAVSAGNAYLGNWAAAQGARNVVINPTCVEMTRRYSPVQEHLAGAPLCIGWTGSHSTLSYLEGIMGVLEVLAADFDFTFLIICDKDPQYPQSFVRFIPWREQTEIEDLLRIHIGVMPLRHDAWSEGKCGFKLIQYLALGIPAAASPVGVNARILDEGVQGYLCETPQQWEAALRRLLASADLRRELGTAGKRKMERHFSVEANEQVFLSLFSN